MIEFFSEVEVSCGIGELKGINQYDTPKELIKDLLSENYTDVKSVAYILFSTTTDQPIGNNLARFITRNNLGSVICTPAKENPETGHTIKAWLWTIDLRGLKSYYLDLDI